MAEISESLSRTIKSKVLGLKSDQNSSSLLKVIAKNFMSVDGSSTGMARDLNIASQNIKTLLSIMGGTPRDDVDMHFLKEGEREKKLEVDLAKEDGKPTPTMEPKKKEGILDKLKKQFTSNNFIKSAMKYFAIASIIGVIVASFKDTFVQWATGLWDSIKESFDGFVSDIKSWFSEVVNKIVEGVKESIKPFIDGISSFFTKVSDVFISYFEIWKSVITAPFEIIKSIYDKFVGGLKSLVDKLPDWLKEKLGITKVEPKKIEKPLSDLDKRKKAEQEKEVQETERVRKQEEEKQYKGDDEIVRKRLGIEDKTKTMKEEEAKKAVQVTAAPAPSKAPTPAPAPSASPTKEKKEITKKPSSPGFESGKKVMLAAMNKEGIKDPNMRAQIIAQAAHESGKFKYTQELGNAKYFQKYEGRKDLGNVNSGDGLKYIGRGFLQTTGRVNYQQFKDAYGVDVISEPQKLAEPQYAAESALFWFKKNAKKVQKLSGGDWSNTKAITKAVNGGYNGLEERIHYFEMFKNDPEITGVAASETSPSGTQVASASTDVSSGQRQQQKSSTPIIVNAPTTNNTTVKKTQVASAPPPKNTANGLVTRVT